MLARYGEERTRQGDFAAALYTAYLRTGPGVAVAAVTTALAFYAVMLADFQGLSELGFIAGSGLLLCLLASLTVLPAMLALYERHRPVQAREWEWQPSVATPRRGWTQSAWRPVGLLALVTLVGGLLSHLPTFDYNLLNLQAKHTESVTWEKRLHDGSGRSSWYALSVADSLPALRQKQAQFEALPAVDRVASVAALVPDDQALRLSLVHELAPYVADVSGDWTAPEPIDLDAMQRLLQKIRCDMANLIIVPLFIGIAVDNGIHLVHRLLEEPASASAPLAHSTGQAIVLTSLTTMVGFGSLLIARHHGIFSLGLLSTLAVGASLLATLVGLPLILRLLPGSSLAARPQPVSPAVVHVAVAEVARHHYDPDYV